MSKRNKFHIDDKERFHRLMDKRSLSNHPPTLTGGDQGKEPHIPDFGKPLSETHSVFVLKNGRMVEQLVRRPTNAAYAFIDQLTFVVHRDTCEKLKDHPDFAMDYDKPNDYYAMVMSYYLHQIFGFGISHNRGKSANFYNTSYNLGSKEISYGIVAMGSDINRGNRETICVELTATGLAAAAAGWEHRLYEWAHRDGIIEFRFTRVDIAHDFFDGEYNIERMLADYQSGGYTASVTSPYLRKEGLDWFNDTNKGRTLYVGSRQSSRYTRGYEKGKQLGDETSKWFRLETEFRNRDLIIPLEVLLYAGDYLAASYPCLIGLFKSTKPRKTEAKKRTIQNSIEHAVKYLRIQGSKAINLLLEHGKTADEIIGIFDPKAGVPQKTHPGRYFCQLLGIDYLHSPLTPSST